MLRLVHASFGHDQREGMEQVISSQGLSVLFTLYTELSWSRGINERSAPYGRYAKRIRTNYSESELSRERARTKGNNIFLLL